jgi:hypothetical protein
MQGACRLLYTTASTTANGMMFLFVVTRILRFIHTTEREIVKALGWGFKVTWESDRWQEPVGDILPCCYIAS